MVEYKIKKFDRLALKEYKKSLPLFTQEQHAILVGTLLGDASMQKVSVNQESNIKWEQKALQKDYIFHFYNIFEPFILALPLLREIKGGCALDRQSYWVRTIRHPFFSEYKKLFYKQDEQGKQYKVVPANLDILLTPRAIAYWYMDDGTLLKSGLNFYTYVLNTQNFSYIEQIQFKKILFDKFKLFVSIHKDLDKYKLYIQAQSRSDFEKLIKPYILPSFFYKIKF